MPENGGTRGSSQCLPRRSTTTSTWRYSPMRRAYTIVFPSGENAAPRSSMGVKRKGAAGLATFENDVACRPEAKQRAATTQRLFGSKAALLVRLRWLDGNLVIVVASRK